MRKLLLLIGVLMFVVSCKKDDPEPTPIVPVEVSKTALILNEGNFQWGNASLTRIDLKSGTVSADVFQQANQRPLGDVFQSLAMVGDELWLVVNNSQKIERVNKNTFVATSPVTGIQSPRYLLPYSNRVYVSDLYANTVHVINSTSGTLMSEIPFPGWSEGMIKDPQNLIWISNVTRGKLMLLNPETNLFVDSITVGDAPKDLIMDKNHRIWVLCEGHIPPAVETGGSLWCIDPVSRSVLKSFQFSTLDHPSKLNSILNASSLIYLNKGVFKLDVNASELPTSPFIAQGSRLFYGLGYNAIDSTIWASDARDYQQAGEALVYKAISGEHLRSWTVGIIPGAFYFY